MEGNYEDDLVFEPLKAVLAGSVRYQQVGDS